LSRPHAFTLLELVVVFAVFGILTALAVPTYDSVRVKAQNDAAAATLAGLSREAAALAKFRGTDTYAPSDFSEALVDLPGTAVGVHAQETAWELDTRPEGYSDTPWKIHVAFGGAPEGSSVGMALRTPAGGCAFALSTGLSSGTATWSIAEDLGANCNGHQALVGVGNNPGYLDPNYYGIPTKPRDLVAVPGDTSMSLTWDAPAGGAEPTVYRIYKDGVFYNQVPATPREATVTGLTNGQMYSFTVRATNSFGTGPPSDPASATPMPPLPGSPQGVAATPGDTLVSVAWSPPVAGGPPTSYRVYQNTSDNFATATPYVSSASPRAFTGLTNGDTYYFWVTAVNMSGESTAVPVSAIPLPPTPVQPPSLVATPGDTQVSLTWTASNGPGPATSYRVYTNTSNDFGSATPTVLGNVTSTVVSSLTNGDTYYFWVTGVNLAGESPAAGPAAAVPLPPLPGPPQSVTAVSSTTTSVDVTWSPPVSGGPPTSYRVYHNTSNNFATATPTVLGVVTSTTVSSLSPGTDYWFWVTGVNLAGESSPGGPAARPTTPVAPTALVVTPVDGSDTTMSLSWTGPSGVVSGYRVFRDGGPTAVYDGPAPSFTDSGLTGNTSYSYTVAAYNAGGLSPLTDPVSNTTAPPAPTGMAVSTSNTDYTGSFTAASGATSYQIQVNRDVGASQAVVSDITQAGLSFSATPGVTSARYQARARATNAAGFRSPWSAYSAYSAWTRPSNPTATGASVCSNGYRYCAGFNTPYGTATVNVYRTISDVQGWVLLQSGVAATPAAANTYTDPTAASSLVSGASGWGWLGFRNYYNVYACNSNGCSTSPASNTAAARWYAYTAADQWGVYRLAQSYQYGGSVFDTGWFHDDLGGMNAWGPGYLGMNWGPYALAWGAYGSQPGYRYDDVHTWFWHYQRFPSYGCYSFMTQSDDGSYLRVGDSRWGGTYMTPILAGWVLWDASAVAGSGQQYSSGCVWVAPGSQLGKLWGHTEQTGDAYFYAWWANSGGWDQWSWTLDHRNWMRAPV
jgi:prepilin-type N-terminal cleavage/methylation domain-containing protein